MAGGGRLRLSLTVTWLALIARSFATSSANIAPQHARALFSGDPRRNFSAYFSHLCTSSSGVDAVHTRAVISWDRCEARHLVTCTSTLQSTPASASAAPAPKTISVKHPFSSLVLNEKATPAPAMKWQNDTLARVAEAINTTRPPTFFSNWLVPSHLAIGSRPSPEDALRLAQSGFGTFVSLIGEYTFQEFTTSQYSTSLRGLPLRVELLHAPIPDFGTPSLEFLSALVSEILTRVRAGERVFVHCRAGLGRTGLAVIPTIATLFATDFETAQAFVINATRATRASHLGVTHTMPETQMQVDLARTVTALFHGC
eukprot:m.240178 g.240178  ORF g.240178 m.240178 type:complete len:314 (-) comp23161_c0_seq1:24-965(-)